MFDRSLTTVATLCTLCAASVTASAAMAQPVEAAAPSGLALRLLDQRIEAHYDGSTLARYRFVAPALAEGVQYDSVADDFAYLCRSYALPDLAMSQNDSSRDVAQIIISFSSKELEFGATAPEIVQFFEVFRVENDRCIWEAF